MLRTSRATTLERLIPPGGPSPFVAGLEREDSVANSTLLVSSHQNQSDAPATTAGAAWPQLTWPAWTTPTGARWTRRIGQAQDEPTDREHDRAVKLERPVQSGEIPKIRRSLNQNDTIFGL